MVHAGLPGGLVDTDILIDAARGSQAAHAFLSSLRPSGILVSVISAMELIQGCRDKHELSGVRSFLSNLQIIHLDNVASTMAQQWMESYRLSHGLLIPDALIAATAVGSGLPLFTKNLRHFQMITQLVSQRPY